MSGFKDFEVEICEAFEGVTNGRAWDMLDWLQGYEGGMAEGVCILLEGDSDVQDGPFVPMYERSVCGGVRLNPDFRKRLVSVLSLMTCCECLSWCIRTANEAGADQDSIMVALLKAYAHGCE